MTLLTPDEVVAELRDGMTIGIGGWGSRRKPMALVRAILRSPLKNLTIVSYAGPDVGLLVASGQAKRIVTGFASLDSIALEPHFRRARQDGTVELTELDEGMLHWGLLAAAHRLPFLPIRAGLRSGVLEVNPDRDRGGALPEPARRGPASVEPTGLRHLAQAKRAARRLTACCAATGADQRRVDSRLPRPPGPGSDQQVPEIDHRPGSNVRVTRNRSPAGRPRATDGTGPAA